MWYCKDSSFVTSFLQSHLQPVQQPVRMMNCHALATHVKRGEICEQIRQVGAESTFDPAPNPYNPCPAALASMDLVA